MANLYESMNKYFENKYGIEDTSTKSAASTKKSLNEGIKSRKALKEAASKTLPVAQALIDGGIKMGGNISSKEDARAFADKVIKVLKTAKEKATDKDKTQFDKAITIIDSRKNSPTALLSTIGTYYTQIKTNAGAKEKKDECVKPVEEACKAKKVPMKKKKMAEAIRSRKALKEGFRNSPYYHAIKRVLNGDIKAADIVYNWYWNEDAFDDFDSAGEFEDYVRDDIYEMLDAADDAEEIKIVRNALGEEDEDFDESLNKKKLPRFKVNSRKVESINSPGKSRMKFGEAKKIVSRKALKESKQKLTESSVEIYLDDLKDDKKAEILEILGGDVQNYDVFPLTAFEVDDEVMNEDLGKDLDKYQKWVDYDMKRYHKISDMTNKELKKAGLQVIKDQYGDYEVTAGHYEEACRSRKSMGLKKKSEITEAKEEKDLWDTIYGELAEDGSQYIAPETGKPRINKGAGYRFDDQIAVDRAGNIVVKTREERDLKAAIDIADKYKDKGVTYNIDQSKYDKNYPYWMTIEIPEEYKECFKESKLTERAWKYIVSDKVSKKFRDAIRSDEPNYAETLQAMKDVYTEIHDKRPDLLDDDDYEEYIEDLDFIDPEYDSEEDLEENINYELGNLYDFCDAVDVFIGI